jgi:hypothetical protein
MPEGYQDHRGVPVTPTVAFHRLNQPLDLGLGEMLPRSIFRVWFAPGQSGGRRSHCELFVVRGYQSRCTAAAISISFVVRGYQSRCTAAAISISLG